MFVFGQASFFGENLKPLILFDTNHPEADTVPQIFLDKSLSPVET